MVGAMRHPPPSTVVAPGGPEGRRPRLPIAAECRTARLLQQQRQGRPIRHRDAVVICPSRDLNFGDPTPVEELDQRRLV